MKNQRKEWNEGRNGGREGRRKGGRMEGRKDRRNAEKQITTKSLACGKSPVLHNNSVILCFLNTVKF